MKRLSQATGNLIPGDDANLAKQGVDQYDRPGIIVHVGEFMSKDGPIAFTRERVKAMVERNNRANEELKRDYGGNPPIGAYPPILGNHNGNTISLGRCLGPYVYEERDIPKVGKKVPCMVSQCLRFIGETNAMMAQDGRIYHLSPGVDELDADLITEVSAVPDPAAAGAMLLSRGRGHLPAKPKRETMQTSKGQHTAVARATSSRGNSMQNKTRFESLKRLSGELKAGKVQLVKAKTDLEFARTRDNVDGQLRGLVRLGKMLPAEYRKIATEEGITRLSKMSKEARDAYFEAHGMREGHVVEAGQRGSQDAIEAGAMAQEIGEAKLKRLSRETRSELKRLGAKLKNDDGADEAEEARSIKRLAAADRIERGLKRMSDGAASEATAETEGKEMKRMTAPDPLMSPSDLTSQKVAMLEEQMANIMGVVDRIAAEIEKITAAEQVEAEQAEAVAESHEQLEGENPGEAEMAAGEEGEAPADPAAAAGAEVERKPAGSETVPMGVRGKAEMAEGEKEADAKGKGEKELSAGEGEAGAKDDEKK